MTRPIVRPVGTWPRTCGKMATYSDESPTRREVLNLRRAKRVTTLESWRSGRRLKLMVVALWCKALLWYLPSWTVLSGCRGGRMQHMVAHLVDAGATKSDPKWDQVVPQIRGMTRTKSPHEGRYQVANRLVATFWSIWTIWTLLGQVGDTKRAKDCLSSVTLVIKCLFWHNVVKWYMYLESYHK